MAEPGYTPKVLRPTVTQSLEQWERVNAALNDPNKVAKADPGKVARAKADLALFREQNPGLFVQAPELEPRASAPQIINTPSKAPSPNDVAALGGTLNLESDQGEYIRAAKNSAAAERKLYELTVDKNLNNASKLKVFTEPAEYEPPPSPGLSSAGIMNMAFTGSAAGLPKVPKARQYWYEPSVEEFREAIKTGALSKELGKEFPGIDRPEALIDKDLQSSRTFSAFKDAAWRHAYADAIKTRTPITRVEFSKKLGTLEGLQARALDPTVAAATGALKGVTAGLSAPFTEWIAPETGEAERLSRMRNPNAAIGGEIVGTIHPAGIAATGARTAAKYLGQGAKRLGLDGLLSRIAVGTVAGAGTGAADNNIRAIADATSDALAAQEGALEAAKRIADAVSLSKAGEGALLGAGYGLGGEFLGETLGAASRGITRSRQWAPTLELAEEAGLKMKPTGSPKTSEFLEDVSREARAAGTTEEDYLMDRIGTPMVRQRFREMEAAKLAAEGDKAIAHAELDATKVPTRVVRTAIDDLMREKMVAIEDDLLEKTTPVGPNAQRKILDERAPEGKPLSSLHEPKIRELKKFRDSIPTRITPQKLDELEAVADARANINRDGKVVVDSDWKAVTAALREARDQFPETASTEGLGVAARDSSGRTKRRSALSALAAKQRVQLQKDAVRNRLMGIPERVEWYNQELPKGAGDDALEAVEFEPVYDRDALRSKMSQTGAPGNRLGRGELESLAKRTSDYVAKNFDAFRQLRLSDEWKGKLGQAVNGINTGGGGFIRSAQLIRTVPTLRSLSGGGLRKGGLLPRTEASPEATKLIDRFMNGVFPKFRGDSFIPEAESLYLKGGQSARPAQAISGDGDQREEIPSDLTPEELQAVTMIIRNLIEMEKKR